MTRSSIASYLEADLSCYHCGDTVGLLRRVYGVPGAPTWYLDPALVSRRSASVDG